MLNNGWGDFHLEEERGKRGNGGREEEASLPLRNPSSSHPEPPARHSTVPPKTFCQPFAKLMLASGPESLARRNCSFRGLTAADLSTIWLWAYARLSSHSAAVKSQVQSEVEKAGPGAAVKTTAAAASEPHQKQRPRKHLD